MSSDIAIKVENLSKCYQIYEHPRDRLKQFVIPRVQRGLGKQPKQYYRDFWALKDVSFEVKKGETVGIIGRNGSGKSTLLQMICGTVNPTGGTVTTRGRIAALLELGSGFNPDFTGQENVYLNAAILGLSIEEIDQRFDAILAFADIGEFIQQPVKTYSSGMMMRLAFAIAISVDPDILIIDEALAVGDSTFQFKCLEEIHRIVNYGVTLLFVSHDIGMVQNFCQKAIYLKKGFLESQGLPEIVSEEYFFDTRNEQRKSLRLPPLLKKSSDIDGSIIGFKCSDGEILNANFHPDNLSNQIFSIGEKIVVRVTYEYKESLQNVSISLFLHDYKMLDVSGKYFYVNPPLNRYGVKGGALDVTFLSNLRPGKYFITVRLESSRIGQNCLPIDKRPAALAFEVTGKNFDFLGTFDIGMEGEEKFHDFNTI